MNFSTPWRVLQTIRAGDDAEWYRGENRVKINNSANCVPPLEPSLAKKMGLKINVNWGELMIALAQARRQYRKAWWGSQYFFNIGMPYAPPEYQQDWQLFVTDKINGYMRDSLEYFEVLESMFSAIVCHGQGPRIWRNEDDWCPEFVAIEDLRIPSDTTLAFKNLEWFGERRQWTPGELVTEAFKEGSKWNKKVIYQMLKNKKSQNWDFGANNYDWETQPEKFAEMIKQDGGYYLGDAMPTFPLWHFYFKDKEGWFMRIVPAEGAQDTKPNEFIWTSEEPVAAKREHLMNCQFGDLSTKAPFTYHGVRSLGFALLEPTFYTNITRCRLLQHVHDNFNIWLRSNDPIDRARAQVQEFGNFGVLKPGIAVVPQSERHQIQADLVDMAMAQLKQLQQEASSTYTQQADTGTKKEQTAFETGIKAEQVSAMTSGLLIKSFMYEKHHDIEICRRFTRHQSTNADVRAFLKDCTEYGIPLQHLDSRMWKVEPVTPLGMGNPTLARTAARELLEIRPLLDPTAQQEALHEIVLTVTNDPRKAARWVPLGRRGITDAQRDAQAMFGTLMQGVPVPPREGLSPIDQIEAMLPLLAGKISFLEKRDRMATPDETAGLNTVLGYIMQLVQQLAQNPQEKQRAKQYSDAIGQLQNLIKGLAQRGIEARQKAAAQNGQNGEAQLKLQAMLAHEMAKMQIADRKAKQDEKQKNRSFVLDQRRQDAATFAQIQRDNEAAKQKREMASFQE